jgi:uncharacterized protein YaiE (UPF0345 family)
MSEFKNVTAVKEANVYFDGKVTSRTLKFEDGSQKSLGIMLPGEYEFGTAKAEIMEILSGELEVQLPNEANSRTIIGPSSFDVPANSKFHVNVKTITDYCCSYVD